jgi:hypothetical protein
MCQGLIDPARLRRETEERLQAFRPAAIGGATEIGLRPMGAGPFGWVHAALQRLTTPRRSGTPQAQVGTTARETV